MCNCNFEIAYKYGYRPNPEPINNSNKTNKTKIHGREPHNECGTESYNVFWMNNFEASSVLVKSCQWGSWQLCGKQKKCVAKEKKSVCEGAVWR